VKENQYSFFGLWPCQMVGQVNKPSIRELFLFLSYGNTSDHNKKISEGASLRMTVFPAVSLGLAVAAYTHCLFFPFSFLFFPFSFSPEASFTSTCQFSFQILWIAGWLGSGLFVFYCILLRNTIYTVKTQQFIYQETSAAWFS
jgi:hypothetical protein